MDGFESIKHEIVWKTLNIRHLIEISPATVSLAKEIRYSIIAIALCVTSIQLIRSWSTRSNESPR